MLLVACTDHLPGQLGPAIVTLDVPQLGAKRAQSVNCMCTAVTVLSLKATGSKTSLR
jgi:hypothetical protein